MASLLHTNAEHDYLCLYTGGSWRMMDPRSRVCVNRFRFYFRYPTRLQKIVFDKGCISYRGAVVHLSPTNSYHIFSKHRERGKNVSRKMLETSFGSGGPINIQRLQDIHHCLAFISTTSAKSAPPPSLNCFYPNRLAGMDKEARILGSKSRWW